MVGVNEGHFTSIVAASSYVNLEWVYWYPKHTGGLAGA